MSSPTPPPPPPAGPAASLRAGAQRLLRRLLRRPATALGHRSGATGVDPLQEVGHRLRTAREARGLSLRQLALETRISITVLEALEKGWRDRLPEPTYLRTMLTLLEQHLALADGSLLVALPPRRPRAVRSGLDPRRRRIALTSIELFSTWQGTALYGLLCLVLIYALNRQQQQLAAQGMFSLRPLPPLPAVAEASAEGPEARDRARVLRAYPDLRPLERARSGQALARLRQEARQDPERSTAGSGGGVDAAAPGEQAPPPAPAGRKVAVDQDVTAPAPRP